MKHETNLVRALEFISEGKAAVLPKKIDKEVFSTESFKTQTEKIKRKSKSWVQGPGIQGIGVGEKICDGIPTDELALRVYVEKKKANKRIKNSVPKTIKLPEIGVCQTDVIEIGLVERESFTGRVRPAMPGSGLGHRKVSVGTFGCVVKRKSGGKTLYILSNSHVLANEGLGKLGDIIIQPGKHDSGRVTKDKIAQLTDWVPFTFTSTGFPNLVDAAIAKTTASRVKKEIRLIGVKPTGVSRTLRRGMAVKKVGRTTDFTTGVISDIHYRMSIPYNKPSGGAGRVGFQDQVLCSRFTAGGDSGSAVLNNRNAMVGLHFAGSPSTSIFNKIDNVFKLLQIELA